MRVFARNIGTTLSVEAGARPTFLTTSEVVESKEGRTAMSDILEEGSCEIGAHFHTWTRDWPFETPDLDQPDGSRLHAMAHQLGQDLEERMLAYTCESLSRNLGVSPESYRGGRWSFGPMTPRSLANCGIRVDSTFTPGISWKDTSHPLLDGPDFTDIDPFPSCLTVPDGNALEGDNEPPVIELPVGGGIIPKWTRRLRQNVVLRKMAGLVNRMTKYPIGHVWLRPTETSLFDMQVLLRHMKRQKVPVWVIMIHSTEIVPCAKFATESECCDFIARCMGVVRAAVELDAIPATLDEAAQWVTANGFV